MIAPSLAPEPQTPDFIWNRLDVVGNECDLERFLGAAAGPGFIDWRPDWYQVYEDIYYRLLGRTPSKEVAHAIAARLSRELRQKHDEVARKAASPSQCRAQPLDLNALFPIPENILSQGFIPAGQDWIWQNWGTPWPIRHVSLSVQPGPEAGHAGTVRFEFLAESWSPWVAVARMRAGWPNLNFKLQSGLARANEGVAKSRGRTTARSVGRARVMTRLAETTLQF